VGRKGGRERKKEWTSALHSQWNIFYHILTPIYLKPIYLDHSILEVLHASPEGRVDAFVEVQRKLLPPPPPRVNLVIERCVSAPSLRRPRPQYGRQTYFVVNDRT
jgi:hypothetical protein